jgi:hypothetical protein
MDPRSVRIASQYSSVPGHLWEVLGGIRCEPSPTKARCAPRNLTLCQGPGSPEDRDHKGYLLTTEHSPPSDFTKEGMSGLTQSAIQGRNRVGSKTRTRVRVRLVRPPSCQGLTLC